MTNTSPALRRPARPAICLYSLGDKSLMPLFSPFRITTSTGKSTPTASVVVAMITRRTPLRTAPSSTCRSSMVSPAWW